MKDLYLAIDVGNVLCNVDLSIFNNELREYPDFLDNMWKAHDVGHTSIEYELRKYFGYQSENNKKIERLLDLWDQTITPNQQVIEYVEKLSEKTNIALLSNMGIEHLKLMPKMLGKIWDNSIHYFSYDVGARKPSYVYYQTFLNMHPEFKEWVYVDDLAENLQVGNMFGFRTFQFALDNRSNQEINKDLERINGMLYALAFSKYVDI